MRIVHFVGNRIVDVECVPPTFICVEFIFYVGVVLHIIMRLQNIIFSIGLFGSGIQSLMAIVQAKCVCVCVFVSSTKYLFFCYAMRAIFEYVFRCIKNSFVLSYKECLMHD